MATFMSVLKGYKKENAWEGGEFKFSPVPSFKYIELSKPPKEYFSASCHWVKQQFLHLSELTCLVLCFIAVMYF